MSMAAEKNLAIRAEYTGADPNLKPAAHAFARVIREAVREDGTFADPELEEEFRRWRKERKGA